MDATNNQSESIREIVSPFFDGGDLLKELCLNDGVLRSESCMCFEKLHELVQDNEGNQVSWQGKLVELTEDDERAKKHDANEGRNNGRGHHGQEKEESIGIVTVTVRCIENLELWVNHIASANGKEGELFLRGTRKDYGSNKPLFFRKYNEGQRQEILSDVLNLNLVLLNLFSPSNDTNERSLGVQSRDITSFSQRLAVLQHYEKIQSIGLDVTKDPKVAAAFAFANKSATPKKHKRLDDSFIHGFFVPGPLNHFMLEPRIRQTDESEHRLLKDTSVVCMDLGAFLPATAKRPRLQKGHMLYNAEDLVALKILCEASIDASFHSQSDNSEGTFPDEDAPDVHPTSQVEDNVAGGWIRWILSWLSKLTSRTNEEVHIQRKSIERDVPLQMSTEQCEEYLLNAAGWDANEFSIVRFRIPKEISFHRFFTCHTTQTMTMDRLLKEDGLMRRLNAAIESNSSAAGISLTTSEEKKSDDDDGNCNDLANVKLKKLKKKQTKISLDRKPSRHLDAQIVEDISSSQH